MKKKVGLFLAIAAGLILIAVPLLAACGKVPAKEIHMLAYKWGWDPEVIVVRKGTLVKLHITVAEHHHEAYENVHPEEEYHHGFGVDDYNRFGKLPVGETEVVEFLADKAGEFSFVCTIWCGISKDGKEGHHTMVGKLVVYEGENPPAGYSETPDGYHYLPRIDKGDHPHEGKDHHEDKHQKDDTHHKGNDHQAYKDHHK